MTELRYLLDTNVISETAKLRPARPVQKFLSEVAADHIYLSVISLGELQRGAELNPDPMRRIDLGHWLELDVKRAYASRTLPVEEGVMETWARMVNAT